MMARERAFLQKGSSEENLFGLRLRREQLRYLLRNLAIFCPELTGEIRKRHGARRGSGSIFVVEYLA